MLTVTPDWMLAQGFSETVVDRFWSKVFFVTYDGGCWLWTGALSQSNKTPPRKKWFYGMLFARWLTHPSRTQTIRAHTFSWMLHYGPIPKGMQVLHNCPGGDNPLCVNPSHLKLGTHSDNMADMKAKGRANGRGPGKLTPDQVREIRNQYDSGFRRTEIAGRFHISTHQVGMIGKRKSWKWL